MTTHREKRLIEEFKERENFTREELFGYYRKDEPQLKEGSLGWRISELKKKNIITPVKRGLYVISSKKEYKPMITPFQIKLEKLITNSFGEIQRCVWETSWLNEFTQHQINKSILIVEIEKGFEESLFYKLKDNLYREVFLSPDEKTIGLYISESDQPIIIKKLLSRAPIIKRTYKDLDFNTPSLEKILVDLFAEENLFYYVQGSELIHIYEDSIDKYAINFTRLFSYAKRRVREKEIRQFMTNHMSHHVKDILND